MTGNSLINLGELSKPATVLVEKISDAIGVLYEPRRIRSIAKAEADAERIRAVAEIEVSDLQRRAVQRWLAEEGIKQENIEAITSKALPEVGTDAEPERIENDWIINFFDKARLISDEEMQTLWAKVLAGEANDPGTYSKRTVNYLASLDAEDARLFAALARFCWQIGYVQPIVLDIKSTLYVEAGLSYAILLHLEDIGLIQYNQASTFQVSSTGTSSRVLYFDQQIVLEFPAPMAHSLPLGCVVLSKVGRELAPLCGAKPVNGFLEFVLGEWSREGIIVSSPLQCATNGN